MAAQVDQEMPSANAFFSVSHDGSVVTFHEARRSLDELLWLDRTGKSLGAIGPKGLYGWPRLSPDGGRLLIWSPDPESGNRDIWIVDVERGSRVRLTSHPANDWLGEWSTDGRSVFFTSDRTVPPSIYRKLATGEGNEEWVSNGAIAEVMLPGGVPAPPSAERSSGSFSAFNNWIAYQSTKSGTREIYIRQIDHAEDRRISEAGGAHPRWSGDGHELFYYSPDNTMMSVDVRLTQPPAFGRPKPLFHPCNARRSDSQSPDYDVTPDGQRFVFSCQSQEVRKRSITVAIRWLDMVTSPSAPDRR